MYDLGSGMDLMWHPSTSSMEGSGGKRGQWIS